jgi:N-acetyl-gamma-glutamylphosphate reductase
LTIHLLGEWIQQKKLIPEINAAELTKEDKIIANPNCSTIQMVLALAPLHKNIILRESSFLPTNRLLDGRKSSSNSKTIQWSRR